MEVSVLFFGYLTERLGTDGLELKANRLSELKQVLQAKFPALAQIQCLYAVNQAVVLNDCDLQTGDEVALMPPFAGG